MKQLKIIIKARDIVENCIVVLDTVYTDVILRNHQYFNSTQKSLRVKNNCATALTLPARTLFTQTDNNGSTFKGTINNTLIGAGATVNVPVYYNGEYKSNIFTATYNFTLVNTYITYSINTSNNDLPGSIGNLTLESGNRVNRPFTVADFTNIYSDPDGNQIAFVIIEGGVGHIQYNNAPYVSGTNVPIADVAAGKLVAIAPNQNAVAVYISTLKVKDDNNLIIE